MQTRFNASAQWLDAVAHHEPFSLKHQRLQLFPHYKVIQHFLARRLAASVTSHSISVLGTDPLCSLKPLGKKASPQILSPRRPH